MAKKVVLPKRDEYYVASKNADWGQVVCNGGPPCFHLEGRRFCLRSQRWEGHGLKSFHPYTPMDQMMARFSADSAIEAIDDYDAASTVDRGEQQ